MKIEYETINDGIFKGYTVAYERKFVAVFERDAEYKRSSLAREHTATNLISKDKEHELLRAYCRDLSHQLTTFCLQEAFKANSQKDMKLFNFKVSYEASTIPQNLAECESAMDFLIETFDSCAIKTLKSLIPEKEREYCKLAKTCHNELVAIKQKNITKTQPPSPDFEK